MASRFRILFGPEKSRVLAPAFVAGCFTLLFVGAQAKTKQAQAPAQTPESIATFEAKVRPVLLAKCVSCHGDKQQIADLRLDKAITPAMAKKVAAAISYTGGTKMPPAGKLPVDELAAMTAWAKAGAPWPSTPKITPKGQFWAFKAPVMPALPKVKAEKWAQNPLDRFVLAKLEEKGMKPAPVADRRTLIRRATFDLTGLPPTPAEIDAFVNDKEPNAFARLIDRLLASPAYGERWGRHWLDVARYADSNGLDENLVFSNAWRYRDWVIDSINADKPIDRFIQEQVAGDLLPGAGDSEVIATGYLAVGAKMLAEDDPQKQELDIIDEQVDTLSKGFLGMTVGCARCHDHKFDPISAKDYYSMAGIFKSTKTMDKFTVVAEWQERPIGPKELHEKLRNIQKTTGEKSAEIKKIREESKMALLAELQPKKDLYIASAKELIKSESTKKALQPILSNRDGALAKGAITFEAEDFKKGNLGKDTSGYGQGIGIIYNVGTLPNVAEYEVVASQTGPFQLDFRYASAEPRSVRVYVNDELVLTKAADGSSGGYYAQHQKWFAEGVVQLREGKNTIKLERDSYFPHFDRILLTPKPGATLSKIQTGDLIPEVVAVVAEKIKAGAEPNLDLPENADQLYGKETAQKLKDLEKEIADLDKAKPRVDYAMAVAEGKPNNLKVHLRGSYLTLGEDTQRGIPAVMANGIAPKVPTEKSGRLELAKWLTDAKNPLTARVFVNRVWRWRFGRGLVGSVDNFGALGDLPTHPELLDWLALKFVNEDGWSLKKLHKRLMLTNTYMMSTKYDAASALKDPDNRFLWRFNRRRLEAEAIRDSIFFVAGMLDRTKGGTLINLPPRAYVTNDQSANPINYNSPRRSVYLPVVRAATYDVYTAFDFGDPTVMNGDRASTTIAPQALFMLNGTVVLNATKAQATTMLKRTDLDDRGKVRYLYETCFGRPATEAEVTRALTYLSRFEGAYAKSKEPKLSAWQSLCKTFIGANEFIYVE
ncbi:MAG TPA: DUF1549 domain-containing protein [Fimbriimonas sp.]|nr:DUF1549 domain-containing protein [Fimbriimonas sp.]